MHSHLPRNYLPETIRTVLKPSHTQFVTQIFTAGSVQTNIADLAKKTITIQVGFAPFLDEDKSYQINVLFTTQQSAIGCTADQTT